MFDKCLVNVENAWVNGWIKYCERINQFFREYLEAFSENESKYRC